MTPTPTTRASLLLRLRDPRDHDAWVEFVSLYEPVIYRVLRRIGLQHADASEVLQELLLAVHRNIGRWEHGAEHGSFRGWLRRVTRNLAVSWVRRQKRQLTTWSLDLDAMLNSPPAVDGPETDEFDWELRRALFHLASQRVRAEVRPQTWQAFWEVAVSGTSVAEVAIKLGMTAGAVREECSTADFVVDHLEPSDDPALLGRLGGYDVLDIIGRGGMGVVLKGFDRELKRFVAIKALAPHLAHSALARKRFAREAQAAAAVVNLHVIAIHQVQPKGQLPFLVMPLLTGESLAQRLKARGTLELNEILRIGMQAAEGLAAAHGQGLIHRDVKPANILVEKGVERAVLTDFGLARAADDVSMTRWGIIAGTPEYMSPEQARGEALDGRSDLFSLGCVLYEMATGVSPFRTDSTMATLRRIVDEQPVAMASLVPELPPWLCHIVERLLSKDPAQRFGAASEVSQLLGQCLSHLQQPTSVALPGSLPCQKFAPVSRRRKIFFTGVLVMIASLAWAAMFVWQGGLSPEVADEVEGQRAEESRSSGVLEGTWAFVSIEGGRPNGNGTKRTFEGGKERYAFEGNKLILKTVDDDGKERKTGEFGITVDTKVSPHRLIVRTSKDQLSIRYIYEVKGDTLRMCFFALGEEDGTEVVAWPRGFAIDKDIEKHPTLQTLKRVELMNGVGDKPAPAAPRADAAASPRGSPELAPPFELCLAYFEPGADRTEHTEAIKQSVSDVDAEPVWGEAVDGLQLGVSEIRQGRHFKSGDTIRFGLSVRNVGTQTIRFAYHPPKMCDWVAPSVEKANGERINIPAVGFRGGHKHFTETLEPGAEASIHAVGILALGTPDSSRGTWPRIEKPEPGKYRLRAGYLLQPLDADGKEIVQRDAGGNRIKSTNLTAGTVTFHIGATDGQSSSPRVR